MFKPQRIMMRTWLQVLILFFALLLLVAAAKSDRYVKGNEFHSSRPKLYVKVDPSFTYLGRLDYAMEQPSPDRVQIASYETKSYVFVHAVDNLVKQAVYIQIRQEQTKYVGNLLGDIKTNLRSGICTLGEIEYQCFTRVISLSADEPIGNFISQRGYNLPACVLSRTYARADLSLGIYLVVITYIEDLAKSAFDCEGWQTTQQLTQEHRQFLDKFDTNCRTSFNTVKRSFLKDRRPKAYEDDGSVLQKTMPSRDLP